MHTNILAVLYWTSGIITAFLMIILANEVWIKSLGVTCLIYYLYMIHENLDK
jgi:hypothetical protein